jgi:hypothetical protein
MATIGVAPRSQYRAFLAQAIEVAHKIGLWDQSA